MPEQEPSTTVVQCKSCQKRLKYTGKKTLITCPVCGSIVDIARPSPAAEIDWAALSSNATKNEADKTRGNKIEFSQLEIKAIAAVKTIKSLPRIPTILTGIWIAWLLLGIFFFFAGMVSYGRVAGTLIISRDGYVYSNSQWVGMNIQMAVYASAVTAFLATIVSVLVYVWSKSDISTSK